MEKCNDIKTGDLVISFHVDPDLPHFIIGTVTGTIQAPDGTTRYVLDAMCDVQCRQGTKVRDRRGQTFYPPVNGTLSSDGTVMNNVQKIGGTP